MEARLDFKRRIFESVFQMHLNEYGARWHEPLPPGMEGVGRGHVELTDSCHLAELQHQNTKSMEPRLSSPGES